MKNLFIILLLIITTAVSAQKQFTTFNFPDKELYETYGINLFRGIDGTYFDLRDDNSSQGAISYLNILDWLQGRVPGLQIYSIRNTPVAFIRNAPATIFVDEIRMDASILNVLPVADIALIKVMKTPLVSAFSSPGGVIAIYTKKGEADEEEEA